MDILFPTVAGLCLAALAVRTGYELLKRARRLDPANPWVFGVVLVAMCVMLTS